MKTSREGRKSSTINRAFFLDTNIFIGRVFKSEREHLKCKHVLISKNQKYTSETVRREALRLIKRRKNYYTSLLTLVYNLKRIKDKKQRDSVIYSHMTSIAKYESDSRFMKRIYRYILNRYSDKGLAFYRTLLELREKELVECFANEVTNPLITQSTDNTALNAINALIDNRNDSQILLDMIMEFLLADKEIDFTTMDKNDFLEKREKIKEWFESYFDLKCFFEIIGVSEAVRWVSQ